MRAAEAVGTEAETETATEKQEAAATTKQQKWEQECAKAVRYHQKQQEWRFQLAGLQIGREVVGAGATADRSANQVVRPGCLGLHSRRRDALTAAPQQDTAPLPNI